MLRLYFLCTGNYINLDRLSSKKLFFRGCMCTGEQSNPFSNAGPFDVDEQRLES